MFILQFCFGNLLSSVVILVVVVFFALDSLIMK